jgi:hypothetical protein
MGKIKYRLIFSFSSTFPLELSHSPIFFSHSIVFPRPAATSTKYTSVILRAVQRLSRLSGILPEWNLSTEMKKTQYGVPLNFSTIFLNTPMAFLLTQRGLDPQKMHQYFKFSPVYHGDMVKFAFYLGPAGGPLSLSLICTLSSQALSS